MDKKTEEEFEKWLEGLTIEKTELLKKSEISLILDSYDDIFSDFDPRPYSERALSDDFLAETRRASRDKQGGVQLVFLIPKKIKDLKIEEKIKKRLHDHFRKHYEEIKKELLNFKKRGFGMVSFGVLCLFFAGLLSSLHSESLAIHFLMVLLEPAGWFSAWVGLEQVYFDSKDLREEFGFYEKMSKAQIIFTEY